MPKEQGNLSKSNSHDAKVDHHAQEHAAKEADKHCERKERRR
jgi:hypothetical protein